MKARNDMEEMRKVCFVWVCVCGCVCGCVCVDVCVYKLCTILNILMSLQVPCVLSMYTALVLQY